MWGGHARSQDGESLSDIYTFDPYCRSWQNQSITGSTPHSCLCEGASASDSRHFYLYGGYNESGFQGCLYRLDSKTWQWSRLGSGGGRDDPMRKTGSGMVVYADKLVLFGGYGISPATPSQQGAHFIPDSRFSDGVGWTSELHVFSLEEGKTYASTKWRLFTPHASLW